MMSFSSLKVRTFLEAFLPAPFCQPVHPSPRLDRLSAPDRTSASDNDERWETRGEADFQVSPGVAGAGQEVWADMSGCASNFGLACIFKKQVGDLNCCSSLVYPLALLYRRVVPVSGRLCLRLLLVTSCFMLNTDRGWP